MQEQQSEADEMMVGVMIILSMVRESGDDRASVATSLPQCDSGGVMRYKCPDRGGRMIT